MITLKDAIENWLKGAFVKRYFGKFAVSKRLLKEKPDLLMKDLFSKMVILRAEYLVTEDYIEYSAYSPELFDLIKEGETIPYYLAKIDEFGELSMTRATYE